MELDSFRRSIERQAQVMEIGGFRPDLEKSSSWFGKVMLGGDGEQWPMSGDKPMIALAQVNLKEFPLPVDGLEEYEFISIFMSQTDLPIDTANGEGWELRAYTKISELKTIERPSIKSSIKELPMRVRNTQSDYPCWEDVPMPVPEELDEDYYELFENLGGFKFGGWPTLIQSEIEWSSKSKRIEGPKYIFQIDSSEKANWSWGDNGVGYFGRTPEAGKITSWELDWQCY